MPSRADVNTRDDDAVRASLHKAAEELELTLDGQAQGRLLAYLRLLQRWNATYNLTAVRDPNAILTQHLADCLAITPSLMREMGAVPRRLLDVGSGAGLPGIVIAILCPTWNVVCVDAVGKKAAFIQQVGAELHLSNLRAAHGRVEQLSAGSFDLITSRALGTLTELTRLSQRHLSPGGVWAAMKGQRPDTELEALPAAVDVFHVEHILVPGLQAQRCLIWMRPRAAA